MKKETAFAFYNRRLEEDFKIGSVQLMQEYSDQENKAKEEEIIKWKKDHKDLLDIHIKSAEEITQLKEAEKIREKVVVELQGDKQNFINLWTKEINLVSELKEALESKGKEVEELRGKVNKPYG